MSAIFGIVNLKEKPVRHEDLLAMQQAMFSWGPDGQFLYIDESVGLGQQQLFTTPESECEAFPMINNDKNLIFVASCRIDNREELFSTLGIPAEKRNTLHFGHYPDAQKKHVISDAELIFLCFQKYGKDCVHKLLGDWCFAVWDKLNKELFLARDHCGITSLYYSEHNGLFYFSSSFKSLQVTVGKHQQDNSFHIIQLVCGQPGNIDETIKKNIFSLPPGNHISVKNNKSQIEAYWKLTSYSYKLPKNEDIIDAFREILFNSVACRTRTSRNLGTFLSGGLDSGSVTSISSQLLEKQQRTLYAFTSVPKYHTLNYKNRILDEGIYAKKIADNYNNVNHYLIDDGDFTPYSSVNSTLEKLGQPIFPIINSYWIHNIISASKNLNCNILLSGQHGNYTISWPTVLYISSRTSQSCLPENKNVKDYIKSNLPWWVIAFLLEIRKPKYPFVDSSFINKNIFKEYPLNKVFKNYVTNFDLYRMNLNELQAYMVKNISVFSATLMNEVARSRGIVFCDPTLDKRIIEFCTSLQDKFYVHYGQTRWLIKESMKKDLPSEILTNSRRGKQAADVHFRIKNELERFISDLNQTDNKNSFINIMKMKNYLKNFNIEKDLLTYKIDNAFLRAFQVQKYLNT